MHIQARLEYRQSLFHQQILKFATIIYKGVIDLAVRYPITLNVSEPNNNIGLLKIRQADEETQTLVVQILEDATPKSYEGLQVFFCARIGQTAGLGIIEQKLTEAEMTDPRNGKFEYTFRVEDWQILGRQKAYFSFRKLIDGHKWTQQFSTRDFFYEVTKSVFSDGVKEVKTDGSTYIWTIEDLIRLFDEYIESGKSDWEEFVNQNKEIIESIDPGGQILNELIDSRGEFNSLADRLNEKFLVNPSIDLGSTIKEYNIQILDSLKANIDASLFNLGFQTDTHYDTGRLSYPLSGNSLNHLNNLLYLSDKLDCCVLGGDNIDGWQLNKAINLKNLGKIATKFFYDGAGDKFMLNGNHDDGSIRMKDFENKISPKEIISSDEFKQNFQTKELLYGEIRDEDSLYFYKDYPGKKVRLIGVDTTDVPEIVDDEGNIIYYRQWYLCLRERQLKWLAQVALKNVPEDYVVLMISHSPLNETPIEYPDFTEYHYNHNALATIIECFKQGTFANIVSTVKDFEVNFSVDFSSQGPRQFAGWINGHTHSDTNWQNGSFKVIHCKNSVCTDETLLDTTNEDALTIVSVDTVNKKIILTGFGNATASREFAF